MFIFGYDKVLERLERVIHQLVELQAAEEQEIEAVDENQKQF